MSWYLKSHVTQLFVQQIVEADNNENVIYLHYWPPHEGDPPVAGGPPSQRSPFIRWKIFSCHDVIITEVCYVMLSLLSTGLTHCGLVTIWWHSTGPALVQVMVCCLTAPSHYLNLYWFMFKVMLWNSPESNFTSSARASALYYEFEKYAFKITAASPRGQWVHHFTKHQTGPFSV